MMQYGAYKTAISMSPFQLIYDKLCHLPVELEHKVYWAIKVLNYEGRKSSSTTSLATRTIQREMLMPPLSNLCFKYAHRVLAHTIFGCGESDNNF